MLNIATGMKKKNDRIARGSVLLSSAAQVQTSTLVCAMPCISNKYPG